MPLPRLYGGFAYGAYQWLCMVAILGFARRWLTADPAARRYLTDAIFPYYIVHQTAIIMIAHALHGQRSRGLARSEHRDCGHGRGVRVDL